jgi:5-oxoprolinase (ATP-hydrolysing) subunit C
LIEVVSITGLALVQDGGRPGHMHEGVPPGGALVSYLLARANAAVRNAPDAAALEIFGTIALRSSESVTVASDDGQPAVLRPREAKVVACGVARVRYVAVRGGIAVPKALGGRGTLLVAGMGGHAGRPLGRGDQLGVGAEPECLVEPPVLPRGDAPIVVIPGPDLERFDRAAFGVLLGSEYRVSPLSDRVGARLVGPSLGRTDDDAGVSAPMVRGAIQVPGSGEPIVLGPDHPTMGGYPVLATVVAKGVDALMARPPGAAVRFAATTTRATVS